MNGERSCCAAIATSRDDEAQRAVAQQGARNEPGLREHLEAVADPEHETAIRGERRDGTHDRREPGDDAGAEVVAVGEPAGQDDGRDTVEVGLLVPELDGLRAGEPQAMDRVGVAVRAREDNDADPDGHAGTPAGRAQALDLELLDQRVAEQLVGESLDHGPGARLVSRLDRQLDASPDPHVAHRAHVEVRQALLHRAALRIEDAVAREHVHCEAETPGSSGDHVLVAGSARSWRRSVARRPPRTAGAFRPTTSSGNSGPGGVLSQPDASSQSRTNCLS